MGFKSRLIRLDADLLEKIFHACMSYYAPAACVGRVLLQVLCKVNSSAGGHVDISEIRDRKAIRINVKRKEKSCLWH